MTHQAPGGGDQGQQHPSQSASSPGTSGPPGMMPPVQSSPLRKRHRLRNSVLGIVAALVVLTVISAVTNGGRGSGTSAGSARAKTQAITSPSPAATLTAAEQKFVDDLRSYLVGKGVSNPSTDAQLGALATEICTARKDGGRQADVIRVTGGKSESAFSMPPRRLILMAERDVCPSEVPQPPKLLIDFSGSGIRNSAPFTVGSQVTVKYSYDCSSSGGQGNFIADLEYGNQASLNSDDQSIANDLSTGGSQTTTVYPQDPGQQYYLSVNSECSWDIKVYG